jgi:hypothetical protein
VLDAERITVANTGLASLLLRGGNSGGSVGEIRFFAKRQNVKLSKNQNNPIQNRIHEKFAR